MKFSDKLSKLRSDKKLTQAQVADYISHSTDKPITFRAVSYWENGTSSPSVEQFLVLCELYNIYDINNVFRGIDTNDTEGNYRGYSELNELGRSRVEEYIAMLTNNSLFSDSEPEYYGIRQRYMKLYDVSVAAGTGNFLDSDSYEEIEVDETVPEEADFAVRVSGDSMTPRFVDGQIVFIKSSQWIDIGETGIFSLNGDAYIKKLGHRQLISLNPRYEPIKLNELDSLYVFGKVVG